MLNSDIVMAAIAGDKESFGVIYDTYSTQLYRLALYTLGNTEDAHDAVADTFFEALKGIKNLRDPSKVKNWLFTILSARMKRNVARYIKDRSNQSLEEMTAAGWEPGGDGSLNFGEMHLYESLSELSDDERRMVVLSALGGYTIREIAEMMDVPQGTVSSKLSRSYKKLRVKLEG